MIRFASTQLRPVLSQQGGMQRPLIPEKNLGIYIRVPDDKNPGEWLKAWAVGCNPSTDENWSENADALIAEEEYSFKTFMAQSTFDAVLNEHHDLFMTPVNNHSSGMTVKRETHPPQKVYVSVDEFRNQIQWLHDLSLRHFHACVGNAERLRWRLQALYVLDQVIRLDSTRAKPVDRKLFDNALCRVRDCIRQVMLDGSVRYT